MKDYFNSNFIQTKGGAMNIITPSSYNFVNRLDSLEKVQPFFEEMSMIPMGRAIKRIYLSGEAYKFKDYYRKKKKRFSNYKRVRKAAKLECHLNDDPFCHYEKTDWIMRYYV